MCPGFESLHRYQIGALSLNAGGPLPCGAAATPPPSATPLMERAAKWPISRRGGYAPLWAHSGRELFYISVENEMVSVSLNTDPVFEVAERRVLFELSPDFVVDSMHTAHDISRDDRRFIMVRSVGTQEAAQPQFVIVDNFFEELKERVGRNR